MKTAGLGLYFLGSLVLGTENQSPFLKDRCFGLPSSPLPDQSLLVVSLQGTCCRSCYVSVDDPGLSPPAACDLVVISMPFLPPVVSGFLFLPHVVSSSPGWGGATVAGGSSWNPAAAPWATLCSVPALAGAGKHSITEEGVGLGQCSAAQC